MKAVKIEDYSNLFDDLGVAEWCVLWARTLKVSSLSPSLTHYLNLNLTVSVFKEICFTLLFLLFFFTTR